jgi:hypothetical protein
MVLARMFKPFFILHFLCLLAIFPAGKAEKGKQLDYISIPTDSSIIFVQNTSPVLFDKYRKDKAFLYRETQPVLNGFWKKLFFKLAEILQFTFKNHIFDVVIILVFIFVFIALLVILLGGDIQSLFSGNRSSSPSVSLFSGESIETTDFDTLIAQEIEKGNFNLALRFVYLKLLQSLTHLHYINWQKDKTNREYMLELSQKSFIGEFKNITNIYEYVWYGKFQISTGDFLAVKDNVNLLITRLNE